MRKIGVFVKREAVLSIAFVLAAVSAAAVPPDAGYLSYIDFRVLALLWCLMTVVAGLRRCGVFDALAAWLLRRNAAHSRALSVILVLLPFFTSMAVTNDVALLTFVPFTIGLLASARCEASVIPMLVLQTLAANLGSMATPVGNPQNLYLYGAYSMSAGEFFSAVLPFAGAALLMLSACALPVLPRKLSLSPLPTSAAPNKRELIFYLGLFLLCLLSVFRLLAWYWLLLAVLAAVAFFDRRLLAAADYPLIFTFVCFFVFSGNLGRIGAVNQALRSLMEQNVFLTSVAASQVISNVPAAVLLSGFTDAGRELMLGTDIGGLGTPVASLASLITMKFYLRTPGKMPGRFLAVFFGANAAFLALFIVFYYLMY